MRLVVQSFLKTEYSHQPFVQNDDVINQKLLSSRQRASIRFAISIRFSRNE